MVERFKSSIITVSGNYYDENGANYCVYSKLIEKVEDILTRKFNTIKHHKYFYLALPSSIFWHVANCINYSFPECPDINRKLIMEKPFGYDTDSCNELFSKIKSIWSEKDVLLVDHYLGKELVNGLHYLKFCNPMFENVLNNECVRYVEIQIYEDLGTDGRGGYFEKSGIIRDLIQNHMLQLFSIITMDRPKSINIQDIQNAKCNVLSKVLPIENDEILVGQYTANPDINKPGYLSDPDVPDTSITPTFAAMVLRIDNDTWRDVPFILSCGKAMAHKVAQINVHLFSTPIPGLETTPPETSFSINIQPDETISLNLAHKKFGMSSGIGLSKLILNYRAETPNARIPDAYEVIVSEVLEGDSKTTSFPSFIEQQLAWKLLSPPLHMLQSRKVKPYPYPYKSNGPSSFPHFVEKIVDLRDLGT